MPGRPVQIRTRCGTFLRAFISVRTRCGTSRNLARRRPLLHEPAYVRYGYRLWVPEIVSSAPDLGFLLPDRYRGTSNALDSDSGTISFRDLPPALPDLRAAVRLSG
jgi:hypothetical protein